MIEIQLHLALITTKITLQLKSLKLQTLQGTVTGQVIIQVKEVMEEAATLTKVKEAMMKVQAIRIKKATAYVPLNQLLSSLKA